MSVLDKATAHFRSQLNNEMTCVDVPEWESKIYFKKISTLREEAKILELSQAGKTVEALVESIIQRARSEDGSKMFTTVDKVAMMNEVDPKVIIRIAGAMNEVDPNQMAEIEKN
jgi:hypothetical protein